MENYIFFGSSEYALSVLHEIFQNYSHHPICLIDKDMNQEKCKHILSRLPFLKKSNLFDASLLDKSHFLDYLKSLNPRIGFSVNFMVILKKEVISLPTYGIINLHPSALPYNRGNWPEFWSIVNRTPAGVSLYIMDEGIDTGSIICQKLVEVFPEDTGETLYKRIENEGIKLVQKFWKEIMSGSLPPKKQEVITKINTNADFNAIIRIDADRYYKAIDLINILRASTMPDFVAGAYFLDPITNDPIMIQVKLERDTVQRSRDS